MRLLFIGSLPKPLTGESIANQAVVRYLKLTNKNIINSNIEKLRNMHPGTVNIGKLFSSIICLFTVL